MAGSRWRSWPPVRAATSDQPDAAVVALQIPELRSGQREPWFARLAYAYAEALEAVGSQREALSWLRRAVDADRERCRPARRNGGRNCMG